MIELDKIMAFYPRILKSNIKVNWSNKRIRKLFESGFKLCNRCLYLIKIDELRCRLCGQSFRTRCRNTSNKKWKFAERRSDPQIIRID